MCVTVQLTLVPFCWTWCLAALHRRVAFEGYWYRLIKATAELHYRHYRMQRWEYLNWTWTMSQEVGGFAQNDWTLSLSPVSLLDTDPYLQTRSEPTAALESLSPVFDCFIIPETMEQEEELDRWTRAFPVMFAHVWYTNIRDKQKLFSSLLFFTLLV